MLKIPDKIRAYQVGEDDFPIKIAVHAENLPFCLAAASDVQIRMDGMRMRPIPVVVKQDPADLSISWSISIPPLPPDLTLLERIDCTFPINAASNSRYKVTITSNKGDVARTFGSPPTINPRSINLKFYYR